MKLALVDLDGTLFDTALVNYHAYKEALEEFGFSIDQKYFCEECNGKHYKTFLSFIVNNNEEILESVHHKKKELYPKYLKYARKNEHLFQILEGLKKQDYKISLCTTASKKNVEDILNFFGCSHFFDSIVTQEDVIMKKPNPEVFLKAMEHFEANPKDTIIFEDAEVGIEAARKTGASVFVIHKF